ncbi:MAG TPA: ABC transporter ATP-binding protein, partial [Luteimonas sp.]|nr:ABC transporter ATP-binding protein [Luteimonas sp.]
LLLVSHDRDFLDNVVTSTLVMEGDGRVGDYVGGYSDWLRQRASGSGATRSATDAAAPATSRVSNTSPVPAAPPARKLSYKDARELEQLPLRIEALEAELATLAAAMNAAGFFQQPRAAVDAHQATMGQRQADLDAAYARWTALDAGNA